MIISSNREFNPLNAAGFLLSEIFSGANTVQYGAILIGKKVHR
jgi:hypothetical protein